MFSLFKKRKHCVIENNEKDIKNLISYITKCIKGKNENDILYQKDEHLLYLNVKYPNKISINNLINVKKNEFIKDVVLKRNLKKEALTLVIVLDKSKQLKIDTNLRIEKQNNLSKKIKKI